MWGAIKYNLANLTNFNGRDARQTFWYYVLFLVVVQFGLGIVMAIPLYIDIFTQAFNAAQSGMGEEQVQAMIFTDMAGYMNNQAIVSAVLSLVMVALLLASFVRRLHDSGKPGCDIHLLGLLQPREPRQHVGDDAGRHGLGRPGGSLCDAGRDGWLEHARLDRYYRGDRFRRDEISGWPQRLWGCPRPLLIPRRPHPIEQ